jgi:hypothetical protein
VTTRPANGGRNDYVVFDDGVKFSAAVASALGTELDIASLLQLNTNLVEATDQYMILSIKDEGDAEATDILCLRAEGSLVYSRKPPRAEMFREFERLYSRSFGRTTVIAFVYLNKVLVNYKARIDSLLDAVRELDREFDQGKYRELLAINARISDRLEDFHELLVRLQERAFRHVETRYLSFDWNVLLTESQTLQDRVRRRINYLRDLARDQELRSSVELNRRIEHLNVVVRRLTALAMVIAVPTLISSHFGMNFTHMPELDVAWAYPAVVAGEVLVVLGGILLFRKAGWL